MQKTSMRLNSRVTLGKLSAASATITAPADPLALTTLQQTLWQKIYLKKLLLLIGLCLIIATALLTAGCATKPSGVGATTSLAGLKLLSVKTVRRRTQKKMSAVRRLAIEETAMSIGARAGLAAHSSIINVSLKKHAKNLDHIFDFNALLLEHSVLPPVLAQGESALNLDNDHALRVADRVYKICKQALFVTTSPNWRDSLWQEYPAPERPHKTLLPKNPEERAVWEENVTKGWEQGIKQADNIFADNLAHLVFDFKGMVLYRILLAQKMVSPPYVARTHLGVTGDDNKLRVNDQALYITALPALQTNSQEWKPAISK